LDCGSKIAVCDCGSSMIWSKFCVESNNFALAGVWLGLNSVKFRNFALGLANFTMYVDFYSLHVFDASYLPEACVMLSSQFHYVTLLLY
jgi:hypothetical protein